MIHVQLIREKLMNWVQSLKIKIEVVLTYHINLGKTGFEKGNQLRRNLET